MVTQNELIEIAAVPYQIMSPKECKPLVAVVQDVALGIYRLTKKHIQLSEKQFFNLMSTNSKFYGNMPAPALESGQVKKWTGKQALSSIIPETVNLRSANNSFNDKVDDKDNFVVIENGQIIQGVIDKKIYQNRTKGLIHSIYNDCNPDETRQFFDNTQKLICNWLVNSGFSIGISDLIVDQGTKDTIKSTINDMKVTAYNMIKDVHMGRFDNKSIKNNNEFFEEEINKILNKAREQTGKLGLSKINDVENRMINMIKSGSKGSVINVAQMIACLGQQNVDGKRIAYGFDNRTLPHFFKFDDGPESRGFVERSFIQGLSPQEFFFHAMGGREGLIDTAVKTSETGYIQRKLVKAMEDAKIGYDYTVRNASGSIIQFLYGEDGMDPIKIEAQSLPSIDMDYATLRKEYLITPEDDLSVLIDAKTHKAFYEDKSWEKKMRAYFDQVLADREYMIEKIFKGKQENSFMYPVSFTRILQNAKAMLHKYGKFTHTDLSPLYVLESVEKLGNELYISKNNRGNHFIQILLRSYLSPKAMVQKYRFNKDIFDLVIQQIRARFYDAIANPSELVGVVAAQSIGEPCTQMSAHKDTMIRIYGDNGFAFNGTISKFIDELLEKKPSKVVVIGEDSVVMDLDANYYIVGVSNDEKNSWRRISQISRHPANGGLVKVTTRSGKTTIATLTHSFLGRKEDGIKEVKGSDLKKGDRIPIAKYIPEAKNALRTITIGDEDVELDREFGWVIGAYLADGNVNGNYTSISKIEDVFEEKLSKFAQRMDCEFRVKIQEGEFGPSKSHEIVHKDLAQFFEANFGKGSYNKKIAAFVYQSNIDFISGILSGYFDGDGNINTQRQMIRCGSRSEQLINDVCVLLSFCGVFACKLMETSKNIPGKVMHTLSIPKKYAKIFAEKIGLDVPSKQEALQNVVKYNEDASSRHDLRDEIDMLPECGNLIAQIGKDLQLPAQSRTYGRWAKKPAIGRRTLEKYIETFEEALEKQPNKTVQSKVELLKQAVNSDVIWDEIVDLEYLEDPKEYVYDFTVPGNDSFMVDSGILVHNTLNTFHSSGISSASKAVRGVPRIKELLSVTKNIKGPAMTIHVKDEFKKDKMKANDILKSIKTTFFKDIVKSTKIYYDPSDFNTTVEEDKLFVETYKMMAEAELMQQNTVAPWLLRLEMDKDKMMDEGLYMLDLYNVIQDYYDDTIQCMFSDDNSENLIFRIKLQDDGDAERDYITDLKALEKNIMENILIKGIKGIGRCMMNKEEYNAYNPETMTFEKTHEWILDSSGTNLIDVMCNPKIDYTRTVSNDVNEIYDVLGVEAARQALYNELSGVIADAELYVNYRHIALLVDTMTNRGYLLSIDRHGINRVDIGPLAKCSFEETTDMLIKAGIFSEVDRITGVSANIMLGQIPPCGTGDSEILIDEHKLAQLASVQEEDVEESLETADVCTLDNLSFDFRLPSKDDSIERVKGIELKNV